MTRRSRTAVGGMRTARIWSQALAEAIRWLTGQMPQMRAMSDGISVKRPALAELLEAAELRHVEVSLVDVALLVQVDRDLAVPLDAGDGVDDDFLSGHGSNRIWPRGSGPFLPGGPRGRRR